MTRNAVGEPQPKSAGGMEKGVTKSLPDNGQGGAVKKARRTDWEESGSSTRPSSRKPDTADAAHEEPRVEPVRIRHGAPEDADMDSGSGAKAKLNSLIWPYLGLTAAMCFFGRYVQEIWLVAAGSLVVFVTVLARRRLARPFNGFIISILAIQVALIALLEFRWREYIFTSNVSLILLLLLVTILLLMIRGNKH